MLRKTYVIHSANNITRDAETRHTADDAGEHEVIDGKTQFDRNSQEGCGEGWIEVIHLDWDCFNLCSCSAVHYFRQFKRSRFRCMRVRMV